MIVVDASALIAFFLCEEGWSDLARYMVRTMSVDHVLKELYNALWRAVMSYLRWFREDVRRRTVAVAGPV